MFPSSLFLVVRSLSRVSSRLSTSFSLFLLLHPPSQFLSIVPSSARGVFRGKRPGLVDGPSHGLQLSPLVPRASPKPLIHRGFPICRLSLSFSVLISLFLRRSLHAAGSRFASRSLARVLFATLHILRGGKQEERKGGRPADEARRREPERDYHPASYVLDIRAESIGRKARESPTA